jgi:hypothetical protein
MLYECVSDCCTFQSWIDGQLQTGLKDCRQQRQIEIKHCVYVKCIFGILHCMLHVYGVCHCCACRFTLQVKHHHSLFTVLCSGYSTTLLSASPHKLRAYKSRRFFPKCPEHKRTLLNILRDCGIVQELQESLQSQSVPLDVGD